MWKYFLLTALTFYALLPGVLDFEGDSFFVYVATAFNLRKVERGPSSRTTFFKAR